MVTMIRPIDPRIFAGLSREQMIWLGIICSAIGLILLGTLPMSNMKAVQHWRESRRLAKGFRMARSTNPKTLRKVSEQYKKDYDVISYLLHNKATPPDVIAFWLSKGAWTYTLRQVPVYHMADENLRQKLLCACTYHPNIEQSVLIQLACEILNNERSYYIDKAHPDDDLELIQSLMANQKLPPELQMRLQEYYNWRTQKERVRHG